MLMFLRLVLLPPTHWQGSLHRNQQVGPVKVTSHSSSSLQDVDGKNGLTGPLWRRMWEVVVVRSCLILVEMGANLSP